MKAGLALVGYLVGIACFAVVVCLLPGVELAHAFIQTNNPQYTRVIRQTEYMAYQAFQKSNISNQIAQKVVQNTGNNLALRFVTGPVGWALLGIPVGMALWQVFMDKEKLDEIRDQTNHNPEYGYPFDPVNQNQNVVSINLCQTIGGTTTQLQGQCDVTPQNNVQRMEVRIGVPPGCGGYSPGSMGGTGWSYVGCGASGEQGIHVAVYQHTFCNCSQDLQQGEPIPATQQEVQTYVETLPEINPLAIEQNTQPLGVGSTGGSGQGTDTVTNPINETAIATEVIPTTQVQTGDVVVQQNVPPPSGEEQTKQKEQAATTTTTVTENPDGSVTTETEDQVSVSCFAGEHDYRTMQSIWADHRELWSQSGLLAYLTLMQNLSWPDTLPTVSFQSGIFGSYQVDFNDWSWAFTVIRSLMLLGATLAAYRIVFGGG